MTEREDLIRRYLAAIECFDRDAMTACCAPDMTQTEYPNLLTPMTRTRGLKEMGEGVAAAAAMLVEQSYEIVRSFDVGEALVMELVWRATLRPGPLPEKMVAYFACFFTFRDGLISSQKNYDCFARPDAV